MRFLFLLFILLPIIEIYVLIEVGSIIGTPLTIGIILLTAVIGFRLFRAQGTAKLHNIRSSLSGAPSEQNVAMEMAEGAFILVAGALLLTPGFVTDAFGFACLIPPIRQMMIKKVLKHSVINFSSSIHHGRRQDSVPTSSSNKSNHDVIEGEYREKD